MLLLPSHHTDNYDFFRDLAKRTRWISIMLKHINNKEGIGAYHLSKLLCLNREYNFLSAAKNAGIAVMNTTPSHGAGAMWADAQYKIF